MTAVTLEITGLNCASCVGRAEKALAAVAGVREVSVNLATSAAQITGEGLDTKALVSALGSAGYPAQTRTQMFAIQNMSCASCLGRVETGFAAQPGVSEVQVNLANETARVTYAVGLTDPAKLASAVGDAGYPARVITADAPKVRGDAIAQLRRKTLIAALLTLPVFVIEMGGHLYPPLHHLVARTIGTQTSWVLQFVLTTLVLAWPGRGFFSHGIPGLWRRAPDMNALVAMGAGAAWVFSTVATFAPSVLPDGTRAVYFEAAAVIVTLILLGRLLEARAKGRTGAAIRALVGLQPKSARVLRGGVSVAVPIDEIVLGDVVDLRPGERVPTDGVVRDGASYVDESMISGEPVPVAKSSGDAITGGTLNGTGALQFEATKIGADTMLAQIIAMVQSAQGAKLPVQDLVNRVTAVFVPVVMGLAVLTVLAWLMFGAGPALGHALVAGVAVLIVACPCAMGLATPTSIMVGTGRAAQLGVLMRKGAALQQLEKVRTVAFDKTGTLTLGRPEMTSLETFGPLRKDEILALAAGVEAKSEHPIAGAILRAVDARGLSVDAASGFAATVGLGATAWVAGRKVAVGSARYLGALKVDTSAGVPALNAAGVAGETPVFVAVDGELAALIGVSDPAKPEAASAVAALHRAGLKVVMITGDTAATAQAIAAPLGINHVVAEVLPAGKVDAIARLGDRVAFVGDGINDAPALAAADVGIAIGTGTDVAIESADIVLMSGDLNGVVTAHAISHAVMRNIRQNLFWAFAYNAALIPVAAGALYPVFGVLLSPMLAAGAMALSSVFVLSNALRLQWFDPAAGGGR